MVVPSDVGGGWFRSLRLLSAPPDVESGIHSHRPFPSGCGHPFPPSSPFGVHGVFHATGFVHGLAGSAFFHPLPWLCPCQLCHPFSHFWPLPWLGWLGQVPVAVVVVDDFFQVLAFQFGLPQRPRYWLLDVPIGAGHPASMIWCLSGGGVGPGAGPPAITVPGAGSIIRSGVMLVVIR